MEKMADGRLAIIRSTERERASPENWARGERSRIEGRMKSSAAMDFLFASSSPTPATSKSQFSCLVTGAQGRRKGVGDSASVRRQAQGERLICRAIDAAVSTDVMVREARPEDSWGVAETHCSSFFPHQKFPLDLALRLNRFLVQLTGNLSVPPGCARSCLVAVVRSREWNLGFRTATVAGILTVDTLADYLPRKGPFRERRTGIAYISNVAVKEGERGQGIGKQLVAEAEAVARRWGCRAIALHCDVANVAAVRLYDGQGYRRIPVPDRADWPQPRTRPDTRFHFMMKLL